MADPVGTTPFKYVTIEQEDDELVIEAGLRTRDVRPSDRRASDAARVTEHASVAQTEPSTNPEPTESARDRAAGEASSAPAEDACPSDGRAEAAGDAYRETTLDDLAREPMPKMQRAVLLGIAVLVIAFAVYVLFF